MKFYNLENVVNFISEYDTYFDTTAILCEGFDIFMKKSLSKLSEKKLNILVSHAVVNKLKEIASSENREISYRASWCLHELDYMVMLGVVKYEGNPDTNLLPAQQYVSNIVRNRNKRKIAVVTNKAMLAQDILLQNELKSFDGNHVYAFRISGKGNLYDYEDNEQKQQWMW